jgi:hypothetical protein
VAEVEMEEFLVFGESRPSVTVERGILSKMARPKGFFWAARVQGGPPDIVFFHSPEPELKWHTFSRAILAFVLAAAIRFTPAGGEPEMIWQISGRDACATLGGGWYYDNPEDPQILHICPVTCGLFGGGIVDYILGCETMQLG